MKGLSFNTVAIHAGQPPEATTGAVMQPIFQTSTYVQPSVGKPLGGHDYARTINPTRTALQQNLAALEGGRYGFSFASGCAALDCIFHTLSAGDHVILSDDVYGGTFRLFDKVFARHGLQYTLVDLTDIKKLKAATTAATKLIWLETPSNPLLKIIDIAAVAAVTAKNRNITLAVDNTFASPYLQNPLALGADVVCHSATKYIGGHSDVIGGALITNHTKLADQLSYLQNAVGAVPAPFDCFLLLRSTKTLGLRMEQHCKNAMAIAEMLSRSNKVSKIYYPGLKSHPQHKLASTQMRLPGGIVTFVIKGGLKAAKRFLSRLRIFVVAESLGGVESLVDHPAIMTHASIPAAQRQMLGIEDGLIRLSVGCEDRSDLLEDVRYALRNS